MFAHNWLFWPSALLAWLLILNRNFCLNAESQNAIGAYRDFPKTSFSCTGRPAGYYADVETGCQIYHMCDGLGRQFSYSCPNTTLFQQRMLICDHWYMVNCSKAESNYAANLLIGQRDKPFVNDEENSLRTPRPDLLDRPYAPDYSGESFRNQYKLLPAAQNRIQDPDSQKQQNKLHQHVAPAGQHRWKIPPPSQLILPPAYEPQAELDAEASTTNSASNKQQTVIKHSFSSATASPAPSVASTKSRFTTASTTTKKPTTKTTTTTTKATTRSRTTTTTRRPNTAAPNSRSLFNGFNSAALHQRQEEHDDLGTSHSTRYNTSTDFNSAEQQQQQQVSKTKQQKSSALGNKQSIKVPSKFYEPPFLYPIYNENETLALTTLRPLRVSSASPFVAPSTTTYSQSTTTTTARSFTRPTTQAGKPFSSVFATPTAFVPAETARRTPKPQSSDRFDIQKIAEAAAASEARTPMPAQGFKSSAPPRPTETISNSIVPDLPSNDLLPPYQEFITHDTATTVGPPIYYEWKIPSNGLEPPKLDPPIGVDGREYPDSAIDYNSITASDGFVPVPAHSFTVDQKSSQFFQSSQTQSFATVRTPSVRSLKSDNTPPRANSVSSTERSSDIFQIRKQLSVPEYLFPLESNGRTGYLSGDTYNSFQLKIPERHTETIDKHERNWFGENPKCPECHPSYVVPGTCEPCLRR